MTTETTPTTRTHGADDPVPTMFSAHPLVGLRPSLLAAAAGRAAAASARRPAVTARSAGRLAARLGRIAAGDTVVEPERGDRRFADDTWREHPLYRRIGQGYLAAREEAYRLVEEVELDHRSTERARLAVGLAVETLSPTNTVLNPQVLRRARETNGASLAAGLRNLVDDVRTNGGMPSMVDTEPFSVGETVAVSPGRVVFKDEVLELIQYAPVTEEVRERPLVLIPPQINKFYVLDIAPGRSLIEHLVSEGQQVFAVSWRNPTARQRGWDLDTYVSSLLEALEAAREITGAPDVNVAGACAGGITTSALLGHVAASGTDLVNAATLLVTVLDMAGDTAVSPFMTDRALAAALRRSQRKGVLSGRELARVFAWLRPNDLVCNYWVNNWLLGQKPPAFDILAWNADVTNLPADLHADFLAIARENSFVEHGTLEVCGTPVDLRKFDGDTYVVAGLTDHITPWESCYRSLDLLGGETEFVLSTSGHIQALVNPPSNRRSSYRVNAEAERGSDAETWFEGAEERPGSWWAHWATWLDERSGPLRPARTMVGSAAHPPGDLAPGRYVHNL